MQSDILIQKKYCHHNQDIKHIYHLQNFFVPLWFERGVVVFCFLERTLSISVNKLINFIFLSSQ